MSSTNYLYYASVWLLFSGLGSFALLWFHYREVRSFLRGQLSPAPGMVNMDFYPTSGLLASNFVRWLMVLVATLAITAVIYFLRELGGLTFRPMSKETTTTLFLIGVLSFAITLLFLALSKTIARLYIKRKRPDIILV